MRKLTKKEERKKKATFQNPFLLFLSFVLFCPYLPQPSTKKILAQSFGALPAPSLKLGLKKKIFNYILSPSMGTQISPPCGESVQESVRLSHISHFALFTNQFVYHTTFFKSIRDVFTQNYVLPFQTVF